MSNLITLKEKELIYQKKINISFECFFNELIISPIVVIDLYSLSNPVHPEGHFGYFVFSMDGFKKNTNNFLNLSIDFNNKLDITIEKTKLIDKWINPDIKIEKNMSVHFVLRDQVTNKIFYDEIIPLLENQKKLTEYREPLNNFLKFLDIKKLPVILGPRKILIYADSLYLKDAIGNFTFGLYKLLKSYGCDVHLFAKKYDLNNNHIVNNYNQLMDYQHRDSILIFQYSIYDDFIEKFDRKNFIKTILYYHKVTDPKFLRVFSTELAKLCEQASLQIPFFENFDFIMTNSEFSKNILKDHINLFYQNKSVKNQIHKNDLIKKVNSSVRLPPVIGSKFKNQKISKNLNKKNKFIFVGRFESSKKIEDLVKFFYHYSEIDKNSSLTIAYSSANESYKNYIDWLINKKLKFKNKNLKFINNSSDDDLAKLYSEANIYISMSEDEGYAVPILEALRFNLLIFSYDIPAIRELTKGEGIFFNNKNFEYLAIKFNEIINNPGEVKKILDNQNSVFASLQDDLNGKNLLDLLYGIYL